MQKKGVEIERDIKHILGISFHNHNVKIPNSIM